MELAKLLRNFVGIFVFVLLCPFYFFGYLFRKKDIHGFSLKSENLQREIQRKYGEANVPLVHSMLGAVREPTVQTIGAIIFLASNVEQITDLVVLANTDREKLLNAATVKDERG